jgi:hypothetical protein
MDYNYFLNSLSEKYKLRNNRTFKSFCGIKRECVLKIMEQVGDNLSPDDLFLTLYHLKNNPVFSSCHGIFNLSYTTYYNKFWNGVDILNGCLPNFNFANRIVNYFNIRPPLFENTLTIVDATECEIQNPSDRRLQNFFYSGKKKFCSIKYQVIINFNNNKIVSVSPPYPGRIHDKTIFMNFYQQYGNLLYPGETILGDKAYVAQELRNVVITPIKRVRNGPDLTDFQKLYNYYLSHYRIRIEHVFNRIKVFRILKNAYRYRINSHQKIFNLCCKLSNLYYSTN